MICLTRINDKKFVLNAELIKFVEESPDTIITLTTGEKIIVKEKADDIVAKVIQYSRLTRIIPDSEL